MWKKIKDNIRNQTKIAWISLAVAIAARRK